MSANETNWQAWVRKAGEDLLDIRNNLAAQEIPWSVVCFHAQQAVEKMLKALQVAHGVQPRRTHDLLGLLEECLAQEPRVDELRAACVLLNPYSVEIRYPQPFPEPDAQEGRMAVEAAEHIVSAIRLCLPAPPDQQGVEDRE
jgi:HEPN domain-containing protein